MPIISTAPSPAHAATTRQLTVEVINRSGNAAARADVQLLNVPLAPPSIWARGRHRQLRPGRYNVAAWIITGSGESRTYTLADQILDMNASKTVVLDARKGHRVRISLNNSAASATRAAGAQLSASIHGVWKFLAKGSGSQASVPVQIYGLQVLPAGLSGRNQAAAGSVTKVAVRIYGPDTPSEILLRTVGVCTSDNAARPGTRCQCTRPPGTICSRSATPQRPASLRSRSMSMTDTRLRGPDRPPRLWGALGRRTAPADNVW